MRRFAATLGAALCALLAACSGPQPLDGSDGHADARPRMGGRIVLDVPLEGASEAARAVFEDAGAMLEEHGPRPPAGLTLEAYTEWMRETWGPWLGARVTAMQALRERFNALADGPPNERVFSAVVAGHLYDDFASIIESLPVPEEVAADRELAAQFQAELRRQAAPAYRRAREAWGKCVEWAPDAPPELRFWTAVCSQKLAAEPPLEDAETAVAEVAWPAECEPSEGEPPVRTPTRPTANRPVALIGSSNVLGEREMDRVVEAVHQRLRRTHRTLRLLAPREVQTARAAAAQRRGPNGATCARAARLEDALRGRHPDLVIGFVSADCYSMHHEPGDEGPTRQCTLTVGLGRQADGTAWTIQAMADAAAMSAAPFAATAATLAEDEPTMSALLGGLGGRSFPTGGVEVRSLESHGAWAERGPMSTLLAARPALAACRAQGRDPVSSIDVTLEVVPDGSVSDVMFDANDNGAARLACIEGVLEDLTFGGADEVRRAAFELVFFPDDNPQLQYRVVGADHAPEELLAEDALHDWFVRATIARCYADVPDAATHVASFRTRLSVAPDGSVTDSTVESVTPPTANADAVATCIDEAVRGARFACSADGGETTVDAVICVGGAW